MKHLPTPPKYPGLLFRWFCKEDIYAELEGDLREEFYQHVEKFGIKKANALYRKEVLRMIRPSVLKPFTGHTLHTNQTAMIKNYTLVAIRNLQRNKLFSAINVFGLSVSMAVALITIAFVTEINSYDNFHKNGDRIWRVNNHRIDENGERTPYATTSLLAGERLRAEYPGIEKVVSINNSLYGDVKYGDQVHPVQGYFASKEIFEVFSFPMLYGNPETALTEPYAMVITESMAMRVFNRKDVVGKVLERNGKPWKVTGVLKDIPNNSHLKFQALASLDTYRANKRGQRLLSQWTNMWSSYAYILLPEGTTSETAQLWLDQVSADENSKGSRFEIEMKMESLASIFPGDGKFNQISTVMPKENVNSMIILTLIVVFSACFNYANLSIARSLKRAKEIGVRKVVGARKGQIFTQFIAEAIMVSVLSLSLAYLLFRLIRPEFLKLNYYISNTVALEIGTNTYLQFFAFAIAIGLLAGSVPALLMTRFKPVSILKGAISLGRSRKLSLRKVLIGLQFTLSMGFAILVTLAYKQYNYALNFDLGYTTENILNVEVQDNDPEVLKSAFEQVPEVTGTSLSSMVPSTGSLNSDEAWLLGKKDTVTTYSMMVDDHYLKNMEHELLAGQNFDPNLVNDQMVVNETFVKKMGFTSNEEALDSRVAYYQDTFRVVGVVKDFHYGTMYNELLPFSFVQRTNYFYYLNLNVTSSDMAATMNKLSIAWESVDTDHDFKASFFSEDIERTYDGLSSSMKTYGLLAIVAISISILGLLGMAAYATEARSKELTIRKVLGASIYNLLALLSKNFLIIIVIAAGIAIPLSIELFQTKIIQDMKYSIDVGFWELSGGALLVTIIALFTIGTQARKAARTNPAETLRNE